MNALAKMVPAIDGPDVSALQIAFARYVFAAIALAPFVLRRPRLLSSGHAGRYIVRTVAGFGGIALMFVAVRHAPLADATAIGFTSPIFAMFFAAVLLRESIGVRRWVAAVIGLSGALIISSPDGASLSFGAMIALAAAVFMGAEIVGVKWLSQTADHPLTILFYSNLTGALMSLATAAPGWVWPSATQLTLLVSIGLVAVIGQACVLKAARIADANFLAPFFYVSLVYSAAIGFLLFDERITSPLIIGGAAILVGAFIMMRGGSTASPRS